MLMSRQYYVILKQEQEQELFRFIKDSCSFAVLPGELRSDGSPIHTWPVFKHVFVPASYAKRCKYVKEGDSLYLDVRCFRILACDYVDMPHIEYISGEEVDAQGATMCRIYYNSSHHAENEKEEKLYAEVYNKIKKWVQRKASASIKDGRVWFYFFPECEVPDSIL